jgi:hypothetical protein
MNKKYEPDTPLSEMNKKRPTTGAALMISGGVALSILPLLIFRVFRGLKSPVGALAYQNFISNRHHVTEPTVGLVVVSCGVIAYTLPRLSSYAGGAGVITSILSLSGAPLGGLGIGISLGVLGGGYCLIWKEDDLRIMVSRAFTTAATVSVPAFVLVSVASFVVASVTNSPIAVVTHLQPHISAAVHTFAGGVASSVAFAVTYVLTLRKEGKSFTVRWQTVLGGVALVAVLSVSIFYVLYLPSTNPSVSPTGAVSVEMNDTEDELRLKVGTYYPENPTEGDWSARVNRTDGTTLAVFTIPEKPINRTAVVDEDGVSVSHGDVILERPVPDNTEVTVTVCYSEAGETYLQRHSRYSLYSDRLDFETIATDSKCPSI